MSTYAEQPQSRIWFCVLTEMRILDPTTYNKAHFYPRIILFILFVFFCFLLLKIILYESMDFTPPQWDYGFHLEQSLNYARMIREKDFTGALTYYSYYPPLVYIFYALFQLIVGYSSISVIFFNAFFWIFFLLASCYFLFRSLGTTGGLFIAGTTFVLLVGFPKANPRWWQFTPDHLLIYMTVLIYCAFYSIFIRQALVKRFYWIGILCGFCLLIKWSIVLYILPLAIVACYKIIHSQVARKRTLLICLGLLIGIPWYGYHGHSLLLDLYRQLFVASRVETNLPAGVFAMSHYVVVFFEELGWVLSMGLALCVFVIVRHFVRSNLLKIREKPARLFFVVSALLISSTLPLVMMSFTVKFINPRWLLPSYTTFLLTILIIIWNIYLRHKHVYLTVGILVVVCLWSVGRPVPPPTLYSSYEFIKEFVSVHPEYSFGFFFEKDTPLFHYANVPLLYKELQLRNDLISSPLLLNNHASPETIFHCDARTLPDYIVVYSSTITFEGSTGWFPRFETNCPVRLVDAYQFTTRLSLPQETLGLYKRKTINSK